MNETEPLGAQGALAILDTHVNLAGRAWRPSGQGEAQDRVQHLSAEQRAELDPPGVALPRAREVVQRLDERALPRLDHEHDVAGGDGERLADLGPDELGDLRRPFDEVEVAAARLGQLGEECLVEVGAHAESGGGDPALPQRRRLRDDLLGGGDPHVGEPVGQQQAAAHGVVAQRPAHLLAPGEPARVQVRAAAIADAGDPLFGRRLASGVARLEGTTTST